LVEDQEVPIAYPSELKGRAQNRLHPSVEPVRHSPTREQAPRVVAYRLKAGLDISFQSQPSPPVRSNAWQSRQRWHGGRLVFPARKECYQEHCDAVEAQTSETPLLFDADEIYEVRHRSFSRHLLRQQ